MECAPSKSEYLIKFKHKPSGFFKNQEKVIFYMHSKKERSKKLTLSMLVFDKNGLGSFYALVDSVLSEQDILKETFFKDDFLNIDYDENYLYALAKKYSKINGNKKDLISQKYFMELVSNIEIFISLLPSDITSFLKKNALLNNYFFNEIYLCLEKERSALIYAISYHPWFFVFEEKDNIKKAVYLLKQGMSIQSVIRLIYQCNNLPIKFLHQIKLINFDYFEPSHFIPVLQRCIEIFEGFTFSKDIIRFINLVYQGGVDVLDRAGFKGHLFDLKEVFVKEWQSSRSVCNLISLIYKYNYYEIEEYLSHVHISKKYPLKLIREKAKIWLSKKHLFSEFSNTNKTQFPAEWDRLFESQYIAENFSVECLSNKQQLYDAADKLKNCAKDYHSLCAFSNQHLVVFKKCDTIIAMAQIGWANGSPYIVKMEREKNKKVTPEVAIIIRIWFESNTTLFEAKKEQLELACSDRKNECLEKEVLSKVEQKSEYEKWLMSIKQKHPDCFLE